MQLIVLGPHRSGTSLLTRLVNMMGAYFGVGASSIGFNQENPKGFWERRDVVECNDEILAQHGCSWEQLAGWTMSGDLPKKSLKDIDAIDHKIKSILLEMDANRPWVMKDPRLCLTFPYWKRHLEVPVIISMTREPLEVALSLKTRNLFSLHHGLAIWEYYAIGAINAMRGVPVIHVSHRDILAAPHKTVETLLEKLNAAGVDGLRMPSREEVESFIEPTLYRSKSGTLNPEELLTPYQSSLWEMAEGKKNLPDQVLQPSELARQIMEGRKLFEAEEHKLVEANRNLAGLNQHLHELKSDMEFSRERTHDLELKLEKKSGEIAHLKEQIHNLLHSKSWKIGNAVARVCRVLTFWRR